MSAIITIENLHKKYTLKHNANSAYNSLRDEWANGAKTLVNRLKRIKPPPPDEEFWALKDINLEIKQGERLGVIGRNGAGKSTLLKVISRIVEPTKGRVTLKGRVSSLLEVGTGFHPELSGRENIFLNGAILGMSKIEIARKFDEIVEFAEVEKFLDTPVKHYSSGMYVRLAFAVASSLEPEILVIDEVLAVGDSRFQKKCLGKMEDASKSGRTIIFVSHNMSTVASMCNRVIEMSSGRLVADGGASETILHYYTNGLASPALVQYKDRHPGNQFVRLLSASVKTNNSGIEGAFDITISESVVIEMRFEILQDTDTEYVPNFNCFTADGVCAFYCHDTTKRKLKKGTYISQCIIPPNFLNSTTYFVGLAVSSYYPDVKIHFYEESCLSFNVLDPLDGVSTRPETGIPIPGAVRPALQWKIERL